MKLEILGGFEARNYVPKDKTYVSRIFTPFPSQLKGSSLEEFSLKISPNYIHIAEYVFSDTWPEMFKIMNNRHDILFNKEIAKNMLSDFLNFKSSCETFLVHCSQGKNRSPAVEIGFNDIFGFGYDFDELKDKFPSFNRYVYKVLKETAKNMNL